MITIKDFLEAVKYQISDGSEFQWNCFGPNARYLDARVSSWDGDSPSASIVFDTKTQTVYQATVYDYAKNRAYRLMNESHKQAYQDEANTRGTSDEAWDNVKYIDLETAEDFVEKCSAIFAGEGYDDRIIIPIDLPDHVMFALMKQAHEQDITFNQHVEQVLRSEINKLAIQNGITD